MIKIKVHKTLNTADGVLPLNVDIELPMNKIVAVYGPSGSGKTTLLRMLSGLTPPEDGYIAIGDRVWYDKSKKINLKPQQRNVGHVFQDYGLFPNMSIRQNIAFGLDKGDDRSIVDELLQTIELTALGDRKPHQLSGGQQQRVALARALVRKPDLLLLDEPLSALDGRMRQRLQVEVRRMATIYNSSTILVSHDVTEVFRIADLVVVLEAGQMQRIGTPEEVFIENQPRVGAMQLPGDIRFIAEVLQKKDGMLWLLVNNRAERIEITEQTQHLNTGDKVVVYASVNGRRVEQLKMM